VEVEMMSFATTPKRCELASPIRPAGIVWIALLLGCLSMVGDLVFSITYPLSLYRGLGLGLGIVVFGMVYLAADACGNVMFKLGLISLLLPLSRVSTSLGRVFLVGLVAIPLGWAFAFWSRRAADAAKPKPLIDPLSDDEIA
jgi:hypothetical protein